MAGSFCAVSPKDMVLVMLTPRVNWSDVTLLVHHSVNHIVTPAFKVDDRLSLRLKIGTEDNSDHCTQRQVQFLLSAPADDVIELTIDERKAILTPGADSFVLRHVQWSTSGDFCNVQKVTFRLSKWSDERLVLRLGHGVKGHSVNAHLKEHQKKESVRLRVGQQEVTTTTHVLTSNSDVFEAMFAHDSQERRTAVIDIKDFDFHIVQRMISFMTNGYCNGWHRHHAALLSISDKYNVTGMKELADRKKQLLHQISHRF